MMNNKFMNLLLDNNIPATQLLLRIIMRNDKIKVRDVRVQNFIQNLFGHSAQLDVLAQDETGRYFNVEIQRNDEGAPAKRARFYSSVLDTHFLQAGKIYEKLPDSYIIFITENDVLQGNLPIYNINRTINENGKLFADGSHIIYVNSKCRDDTPLGKLMQDLYCTDPEKLNYKEFAPRMELLKCTKEGEEKMTDIIEVYAQQLGNEIGQKLGQQIGQQLGQQIGQQIAEKRAQEAKREAKQETAMEFAEGLLADGMSIEFTARHSKLPIEKVRQLAAKISA